MSVRDVAIVGAGPVGISAASAITAAGTGTVRWAVDQDPARRELAADELGATICNSIDDLPPTGGAIAVAAFSSDAEVVSAAAARLLTLGYNVVTTCEACADTESDTADRLRVLAERAGLVVIVTGANPGFAMDRLPLTLARASMAVTRVKVTRRLDVRKRRGPLLAKSGHGLTADEFAARAAAGLVGHVGLDTSLRLVARGLGWPVDPVALSMEPVLDERGICLGHRQSARLDAVEGALEFDLTMASDVAPELDEIIVEGKPAIHAILDGGYHGDLGTTARVARAVEAVPKLDPGLYGPTDLPPWA